MKIETGTHDYTLLAADLLRTNDKYFQEGDIHASILNLLNIRWGGDPNASYEEVTNWVRVHYGPLAQFAVLVGNYNNQVCNGGQQYFDNGYASGGHGYPPKGTRLHLRLVQLFGELGLDDPLSQEIKGIASKATRILEEFDRDDDDDYDALNKLDDAFYKVNEKWLKAFNEALKEILVRTFVREPDEDFKTRLAESEKVSHYWAESIRDAYGDELDRIAEILEVAPRRLIPA